jgi:hypothetical protein
MFERPRAWLETHRPSGWRRFQVLGVVAFGHYLGACGFSGASTDTPSGVGGSGATGGFGGSGTGGQPAPALTIKAVSLETGLELDPTHLKPGAVAEIVATLAPIVETNVRFALLSSETLDAVLSETEVPVDLATGRAAVTLTAPSVPVLFQVRASTAVAEPVLLDVAIEKSGFASLGVKPIHDPPRAETTWRVSAWEDRKCTDLVGSPPPDGPFQAQGTNWPIELNVPSDVPIAVLVRLEQYAWGCTSISGAKEGPITPVEVVLSNVPIKLDGSEFEFTLNLDETGSIPFDEALAPYRSGIANGLLGAATDDVEALLDEMARIWRDAPATFEELRASKTWDDWVRYEVGATAADVLRAPLGGFLLDGVAALHEGGGIVAKLVGSADNASITLKSVFGVTPLSRTTFKVVGEASLDVDAADGLLVGASLEFMPREFLAAAARVPAVAAVEDVSTLSEALAAAPCAVVAATLVAHGASANHSTGGCDEACTLERCSTAVTNLLDAAVITEDTPSAVDIALTASAIVGNDAELLGFCSGGWLGSGVLSPDDPESPRFSVVGNADGEPIVTDGSAPCDAR